MFSSDYRRKRHRIPVSLDWKFKSHPICSQFLNYNHLHDLFPYEATNHWPRSKNWYGYIANPVFFLGQNDEMSQNFLKCYVYAFTTVKLFTWNLFVTTANLGMTALLTNLTRARGNAKVPDWAKTILNSKFANYISFAPTSEPVVRYALSY